MHALARRSLAERVDVGPLRFHLSGEDRAAIAAAGSAFASHDHDRAGATRPVHVTFEEPRAHVTGRPTMPSWDRTGPSELRDLSDAWDATLRLAEPSASAAHAVDVELVNVRERDDKLDLLVRGLVRVVAATLAPLEDAMLLHGLGMVSPRGEAVVFLGESGAGKTTTAGRLPGWRRLSDDTVMVGRADGTWYCAGTPFLGKERLPTSGARAPLGGLCFLKPHAQELALTELRTAAAFAQLSRHALWFTRDKTLSEMLTDQLVSLASDISGFKLSSNLDHDLSELDWGRCRRHV